MTDVQEPQFGARPATHTVIHLIHQTASLISCHSSMTCSHEGEERGSEGVFRLETPVSVAVFLLLFGYSMSGALRKALIGSMIRFTVGQNIPRPPRLAFTHCLTAIPAILCECFPSSSILNHKRVCPFLRHDRRCFLVCRRYHLNYECHGK